MLLLTLSFVRRIGTQFLKSKMASPKRVCIVGSGNWGSVVAKMVGSNVIDNSKFDSEVPMWTYEEMINGQKLTEIINTQHENVKYLAGYKLPENVVAVPDIVEAAKDADFLVFVVPHQFIHGICKNLQGKIKPTAIGVSLIKGVDIGDNGLQLISSIISTQLNIPCAVLMGANIAPEVAREDFCEATIGCKDLATGRLMKEMFQTPYFRIVVVDDVETVELCGALKNIVAVGSGIVSGIGLGDNTRSAVIRLGMMEMVKFCKTYNENSKMETFLESCGVADLVTTCYSGRNKRVAEAFVTSGKSIEELEKEMLNGQKLQGPPTAAEVNVLLKQKGCEDEYPLFTAIHQICIGEKTPQAFIDCLRNHPEHKQ